MKERFLNDRCILYYHQQGVMRIECPFADYGYVNHDDYTYLTDGVDEEFDDEE
jgi:hypothetical protein